MSAQRIPPTEPSLLALPLSWLTRLVIRFPVPTIALGVAAAVLSMFMAGTRLGFRTSRLDLLDPESHSNRLWIEYIDEFGDEDDVVVVVEGPSREQVVPVLEDLSRALSQQEYLFDAVLHEVDLSRIRSKGLHYLKAEELQRLEQFLGEITPIVHGGWAHLSLGDTADAICERLQQTAGQPEHRALVEMEVGRLAESLLTAIADRTRYQSPWPAMPGLVGTLSELSSDYILAQEGRMGFVLLRLAKKDRNSFAQGTVAIDALREQIASVQQQYPNVTIGLTGLPVMENDEMRTSQTAMMEASLLSLVGVACLFIAGFGGVRHPMMTVLSLLMAMAWSFGYITLALGHLNILSMAFGVILIGLGIDFGIHYLARYLQLHNEVRDCRQSLLQTARGVGPGIVTGAATTAIAFFMAGATEFKGVAELGIIAGGGILLCLVAAVTILPAMIFLSDQHRCYKPLPVPLDLHSWMTPLFRWPRLLLLVTVAASVAVGSGIGQLWYDHNLLNLQPEGLESIELEKRLLNESSRSVWYALSIAESPEHGQRLKQQFEQQPSVERVESLARFFPVDHEEKHPLIARIHDRLAGLPERPPRIPVDPPADLGRILARLQESLAGDVRTLRTQRQLELIRDALRRMPLAECYERLTEYQQRMAGDLLSRLHTLRTIANPEPPQLSDLPQGLVTRFIGQDGRHLLKIYAKGDIWDMEAMRRFVSEVRAVDPRATGNPLQTYEASRQMKRSYEQAAWYALAAVLVILYFDFRSLRYTLLAMMPVGIGMLQLFGLLGYLEIPLNPANMIVLPLILGIGIDDGVHVIHDFRLQNGRYRLSSSTASAILITSLTTMVGFGSLMIASHRGLQSLGRVLTIGVCCCLFSSLIMLPALLSWLTKDRPEDEEDELASEDTERRIARREPGHHPGAGRHAVPQTGSPERVAAMRTPAH
ncbi:MAG: MMPL family transporter [Thermoguttaceae bacterium]|jgi:hopanoid biosynthesis associated RND transporter like protein HpnN|nr:MMPL family transporter [Thermoguttaceae bacterium]